MPPSAPDQVKSVQANQVPPIPTPHWGAQPSPAFTVRATTTISAPPKVILDTLLETSTWPKWNNFVPRATLKSSPSSSYDTRLRPDTLFTEHVDMFGNGKPSGVVRMVLLMTALDEVSEDGKVGFRAVWLGKGYPSWALRTERVHEVYQKDGEEGTVYDVFETFSGPVAWAVRVFVGGALVKRFGQWNGELKAFVEGRDDRVDEGRGRKMR
ncbi:hypothetical protein P7C71_g5255, partial [Lecanoromycetidae sp. Uapishka_2]